MKKRYPQTLLHFIVIPLIFCGFFATGQAISRTYAPYISGTVCPSENVQYTVSIPSNFTGCNIQWTVSNGSIIGPSNLRDVTVKWNDTPGAKAQLSVKFSGCKDHEGVGSTREELILSVANQPWNQYGQFVNLDYCTQAAVNIALPPMYVQGTGGVAQPPLIEVAYYWTLPSGWQEYGTGKTSFGTSVSQIKIVPTACAKPGNVTVYGTLAGFGSNCNSGSNSATATISLNGANPVVTVGPQAGYTGGSACNTTPVTFYATPNVALGCIRDYSWEYPASWEWVSESGNSITLRPSGTPADKNPIKAKINFTCGSSVTSADYVPPFDDPVITAPYAICYGGTTVKLLNVAPTTSVTWNPGDNMVINSGQGTPSIVVRGSTENIRQFGKINATIACANVPVPEKTVWVGKARMVAKLDNNQLINYSSSYNDVCNYISYKTAMDVTGSTSNTWARITANPSNTSWYQAGNDINFYFWAVGQTATFRLTSGNNCGTNTYDFRFRSISCSGNPCSSFSVSPNPSNTEIDIAVLNIPAPCDPLLLASSVDTEQKDLSIQTATLISSDGQILHSEKFVAGTRKVKIDVSGVRKGIYILQISNGQKIETHRVQISE